jgi:hypothetical protein
MGITLKTPQADIARYIADQINKRKKAYIRVLSKVGEECVNLARTNGSYQNRTGNLRASIGYGILMDGAVIVETGFDGAKEGMDSGKMFLESLMPKYPNGIVLIVVAGRKYAAYVEARNFDVLTSAELFARGRVESLLKQLNSK